MQVLVPLLSPDLPGCVLQSKLFRYRRGFGKRLCMCVCRRAAHRQLLSVHGEDSGAPQGDASEGGTIVESRVQHQQQEQQQHEEDLVQRTEALDIRQSIASSSAPAACRPESVGSPAPHAQVPAAASRAPGTSPSPQQRLSATTSTPTSGSKHSLWDEAWLADLVDQGIAELKDSGSFTLKRGRPEFGGAADPLVTGATIGRPPLPRGPAVRRRMS